MSSINEKTQARIKKENLAGKNIIPLLIQLLDDKHITINVKSEKTSETQRNRLKVVIDVLKDIFESLAFHQNGMDGYCCRGCFAELSNSEYCELRLGYAGGICYEIYKTLNLKKRVHYYTNSVSNAKSFYSSDKEAYAEVTFNEEEYTICWKPEEITKTSKRTLEDEYSELLKKLIEKFNIHPTTGYDALPYDCFKNTSRNRKIKEDIELLNRIILEYLNDNSSISLCSEKQAYYCAKFLDVDKSLAQKLNKYQAKDILNVYFENIPTTEEEYNDVRKFYTNILKKK